MPQAGHVEALGPPPKLQAPHGSNTSRTSNRSMTSSFRQRSAWCLSRRELPPNPKSIPPEMPLPMWRTTAIEMPSCLSLLARCPYGRGRTVESREPEECGGSRIYGQRPRSGPQPLRSLPSAPCHRFEAAFADALLVIWIWAGSEKSKVTLVVSPARTVTECVVRIGLASLSPSVHHASCQSLI